MSAITIVGLLVSLGVSREAAVGIRAALRKRFSRSVKAGTPFVKVGGLVKALADLGVERAEVVGQDEVVVHAAELDWSRKDVRFRRGAKGKFQVVARNCSPPLPKSGSRSWCRATPTT